MDSKLYSKCQVISEMYAICKDSPAWQEYFTIYDIGVPLARMVSINCANPIDDGVDFIEEAWDGLCFVIGVDSEGEYESFDNMLEIGAIDES